jgi:hypothetical protein
MINMNPYQNKIVLSKDKEIKGLKYDVLTYA